MTKVSSPPTQNVDQDNRPEDRTGLSVQQWMLLVFSFLLGIAAVFTVDKVFLSPNHPSGTAHAAVSNP